MNIQYSLSVSFFLVSFALADTVVFGIQLLPGDLIAAQYDNYGTIVRIDPLSGNRELISRWEERGEGARLWRPSSLVLENSKSVLVAERSIGEGVFRVELDTGNRSVITHRGFPGIPARGEGPLELISTIHLTSSNELIAVNSGDGGFVTKIDLSTGDRSLISGMGAGSGPEFTRLGGGHFVSDSKLIVPDSQGLIFEVDLTSGHRSILSGGMHGSGPAFAIPSDLTVLANGDIYAIDALYDFSNLVLEERLFKVDPVTGIRTIVSVIPWPDRLGERIITEGDSSLLISSPGSLLRYDPISGESEVISSDVIGAGPALYWGDVVIVAVPETATASWLCVSCMVLSSHLNRLTISRKIN